MGFMAGFGPAFAQSFNSSLERRAQRKDDMFKLTYKEYLDRRNQYEQKKSEDSAAIKKAKVLARDMAGNEEAWPMIREWIGSGLTDGQIDELIKNGEFETKGIAKPASPDMIDPVDTQMQSAGLDQGAVTPSNLPTETGTQSAPAPQAPQMPGAGGGMMDKLFPGMAAKKAARDENTNFNQIASVTGDSPDQIKNVMSGRAGVTKVADMEPGVIYKKKPGSFEPDKINAPDEVWIEHTQAKRAYEENPTAVNEVRLQMAEDRMKALQDLEAFKAEKAEQAKAEASGNFLNMSSYKLYDESGKFVKPVMVRKDGEQLLYKDGNEWKEAPKEMLMPWDEDEKKELARLASDTRKIASEHIAKARGVSDLIYSAKDMADIVSASDGNVLAQRTAGLSKLAQDWAQELRTIQNLVSSDGSSPTLSEDLDKIDKQIDAMIGQGVSDLATQRALLDAKATVFAYKLGITMGQEGRALAEAERKVFQALADAGSSPQKFNQNLANLLKDQVRSLEGAERDITQHNNDVKAFQSTYDGWNEPPFEIVPSFSSVMNKEPELRDAYDYFKPFMNTNARETPQTQQAVPEGYTAIGRTPDGKTVYRTPDGKQVVGK
jgi:hypothetical protein